MVSLEFKETRSCGLSNSKYRYLIKTNFVPNMEKSLFPIEIGFIYKEFHSIKWAIYLNKKASMSLAYQDIMIKRRFDSLGLAKRFVEQWLKEEESES